jgi:polysaccharide export outer membrane protein
MPIMPPRAPRRALRARLGRLASGLRPAAVPTLVPALAAAAIALAPAPADAQGEYTVGRGDVLRIEVLEDDSLNRSVLVAPSGQVTVPLAGEIAAAGRSLSTVQAEVRSRLAPNFSNPPTVFVSLERVNEPRDLVVEDEVVSIYVLGEVGNTGELELEPGTTLLQALSRAGGFGNFAATKRIQLRRRDPETGIERIYPIDYEAILRGTSPNGTVVMAEGDVIVVPTRRLFE